MVDGISIIIPNFNGKLLLEKYLPYLLEAVSESDCVTEIIVVDDASSDDSVKMLKQVYPNVRVIEQSENLGFGKTCNNGVKSSSYDKLLFLNTDMRVNTGFLKPLVETLDRETFAVSGKIVEKIDDTYFNFGLTYAYLEDGVLVPQRHRLSIDDAIGEKPGEILWASGGMMLCWKDKFLELGGFDPIYSPFYWEDTDLSYRAKKMGWKIYYQPRSVVYHEHQGTIGRIFSSRTVNLISRRNQLLFMWKNITDRKLFLGFIRSFFVRLLVPNLNRQIPAMWSLRYVMDVFSKRKSCNYPVTDNELLDRFRKIK